MSGGLTLKELTKFGEHDLVECAVAHLSPAGTSQEGEILRASDPRVQFAPHLFCRQGDPVRPTPFDTAVEANEQREREAEQTRKEAFETAATSNAVKIEPPRLVRLKRDLACTFEGTPTTLRKGSQLPADHPVVVEHTNLFA